MESNRTFTIYYDGSCPLCSREIRFYRARRGAGRLRFVDVSRAGSAALGVGLDRATALRIFHVRDESGDLIRGADAFVALWCRLPTLRWAGRLGQLPGVRQILRWGYLLFLRYRNRGTRPMRGVAGCTSAACDSEAGR